MIKLLNLEAINKPESVWSILIVIIRCNILVYTSYYDQSFIIVKICIDIEISRSNTMWKHANIINKLIFWIK